MSRKKRYRPPATPVADAEQPREPQPDLSAVEDEPGTSCVDEFADPDQSEVPVSEEPQGVEQTDVSEKDPIVPLVNELMEIGWTELEAGDIVRYMRGVAARRDGDDTPVESSPQPTGCVPGLRLMVKRGTRFWCAGRALNPGIPVEVAIGELTDAQMSEIATVRGHHITVEEIEIPVYDVDG